MPKTHGVIVLIEIMIFSVALLGVVAMRLDNWQIPINIVGVCLTLVVFLLVAIVSQICLFVSESASVETGNKVLTWALALLRASLLTIIAATINSVVFSVAFFTSPDYARNIWLRIAYSDKLSTEYSVINNVAYVGGLNCVLICVVFLGITLLFSFSSQVKSKVSLSWAVSNFFVLHLAMAYSMQWILDHTQTKTCKSTDKKDIEFCNLNNAVPIPSQFNLVWDLTIVFCVILVQQTLAGRLNQSLFMSPSKKYKQVFLKISLIGLKLLSIAEYILLFFYWQLDLNIVFEIHSVIIIACLALASFIESIIIITYTENTVSSKLQKRNEKGERSMFLKLNPVRNHFVHKAGEPWGKKFQ